MTAIRQHSHFLCWSSLFWLMKMLFNLQDLAAAIDEEDVATFTKVVKEFDSMTPLVCYFSH